jgi:hypothetical protein
VRAGPKRSNSEFVIDVSCRWVLPTEVGELRDPDEDKTA